MGKSRRSKRSCQPYCRDHAIFIGQKLRLKKMQTYKQQQPIQRDRQTDTDRQTARPPARPVRPPVRPSARRQPASQPDRQTDRHTDRQTHRHTDSQPASQTDRQRDRQTGRSIFQHVDARVEAGCSIFRLLDAWIAGSGRGQRHFSCFFNRVRKQR